MAVFLSIPWGGTSEMKEENLHLSGKDTMFMDLGHLILISRKEIGHGRVFTPQSMAIICTKMIDFGSSKLNRQTQIN
jgi:hypothetical protein